MFVFVLPIITTISVVYFLSGDSEYLQSHLTWITLVILVGLCYLNALFYYSSMSKTKILPSISAEFMPGIAIGIILDRNIKGHKWMVVLPFIVMEFQRRK